MATTRFHALQVQQVQPQTRDAIAVTFAWPRELESEFTYLQGQYLTLRTRIGDEEVRRSYSICSAVQDHCLRVAIKRVPGGVFSNWAAEQLRPGVSIDVMPPQGQFHLPLQPDAQRHVVAFASGSGITPVLSIVKSTLLAEPQTRVTLVYGNRSSGAIMFKEQLEDLKDRYLGRFNLVWIMSRETQDIDLFNGRIDYDKCCQLLAHWLDPTDIDAQVLACLAAAPAIVGLDLRRDRAVTLMGEFYPLATVDDLAALFATLGIEALPALPAQPGP